MTDTHDPGRVTEALFTLDIFYPIPDTLQALGDTWASRKARADYHTCLIYNIPVDWKRSPSVGQRFDIAFFRQTMIDLGESLKPIQLDQPPLKSLRVINAYYDDTIDVYYVELEWVEVADESTFRQVVAELKACYGFSNDDDLYPFPTNEYS